jgi:hypothetical protein
MRRALVVLAVVVCSLAGVSAHGQHLYRRDTDALRLIYYDKAHEYLTYHLTRSFENSLAFHRDLFDYTPSGPIVILFQDFGDFGHGGTSTVPWNYISIGIEPFDYVYDVMPANERMNWLMHHELVHVVATDKGAGSDLAWRKLFRGKVAPEQENPLSMAYSYLTSPRWYAPRWFHEGIAVFLETWMAGGMGRTLGGYDEMVFRTMALENAYFYDVVGLESEGTAIDFQVGQNSYLYGTRFVSYLASQHGTAKLLAWFDRKEGSERYFSKQFEKVYGTSLDAEWGRWIAWEKEWQAKNLAQIRAYPVTAETAVPVPSLGSVSRSFYDASTGHLYAAVNYPGTPAHIAAIDVKTGTMRRLANVNGPALYYVTSLAYDRKAKKLFYTGQNSRGWRDLYEVDARTGEQRSLLQDFRTGDLVINPADQSLWGMQHHNGWSSLVRSEAPYTSWRTVLKLDYGRDMYDLDISPDGTRLSYALVDVSGKSQLAMSRIERLLAGDSAFDVLHEFPNNTPSNFVFAEDGKQLIGSSYYTGVSNLFRYDFETRKMDALTNAETGYFRPIPFSPDSLLAYRFGAKGFAPVVIRNEVLTDVNAVRYLGQQVVEAHPEVKEWNAGSPARVDLDAVTRRTGDYNALRSVRLASMFPTVEGYKDSAVVGMRFNFADPLGLHSLKVTTGITADRSSSDERLHLTALYRHGGWEGQVRYNATDFYDLFGPTKTSRKGHSVSGDYSHFVIYDQPRTLEYSVGAAYWGGLDTLPEFQDVAVQVSEYSTAHADIRYKNLKRTIGAVDDERGIAWSAGSRVNVAHGDVLPRLQGRFDAGFSLPLDHTSLWIRTAAGKSFAGDADDPFANFYFGGFGNNWVDYREVQRYRSPSSFPGVNISDIGGSDFAKTTLELTLPAVKFRSLGVPSLYSNWARLSLFTSGLMTNITDGERHDVASIGGQVDLSLVLFSNMDATLSVGYARAFEHGSMLSDEYLLSLKLLR